METVKYVDSFGFTEEEVFAALEEYDLPDQKQQVKDRSGIFETRGHEYIFTARDYNSPSVGIPVFHGFRAFRAWRFFLRKVIPCIGNHTCFRIENR